MSMRPLVPGDILVYDVYDRYETAIILTVDGYNNTVLERLGIHRWDGIMTVNELGIVWLDDFPTSWKLIATD